MSAVEKLQQIQSKNKSIICLGLDLDPKRMPQDYTKSIKAMYDFVMTIIEATSDMVCAYKPNLAFYENKGAEGMSLLTSIVEHMPEEVVIILDGKRGDIGNTASFYAEAMYRQWKADWVTLSPYMGYDSMRPFLEYEDKGIFVLCLTSNTGSKDFQHLIVDGKPLYRVVAEKVSYWNKDNNCGLVVGATQPDHLKELRDIAGNMPLLIPGVGAQGGSLEKAAVFGTDNFQKIAVINVCRSVLYASAESDYAQKARDELQKLNDTVNALRTGEIKLDIASQPLEESSPESPPESSPESGTDPPKKEWKLPPIPDLPFMKKKEESQPPAEGDRPDGQQDRGQPQGSHQPRKDFRRRDNNRNYRGGNYRDNRGNRHNRNFNRND
ncbi:MAG: orotidine-5'-phosphate decarboxylase [Candidatus Zixiibacteriota bacterium]|nr:MAG: orotidine-5'-phosphate decarboxylase [candidate division Zixibacteria bacterium]